MKRNATPIKIESNKLRCKRNPSLRSPLETPLRIMKQYVMATSDKHSQNL